MPAMSSVPKATSPFPVPGKVRLVPEGVCIWFGRESDPELERSVPVLYAT